MNQDIITIGFEIPGYSNRCYNYFSDQSLLDADIVIFEPEDIYPSFDEAGSIQIKRQTSHWSKEISTALEYGKTVFVIFGKYKISQIHTGQKDFKGSRTINYVTDFNNYQFLPISVPQIISKGGTGVVFVGHPAFATFWKQFKNYLVYESYLNDKISIPVFVTKTGAKPIGGIFKIGKGNLVLLPPIKYSREKFIKEDKKKQSLWTKPALVFGNKLVNLLFEIDKVLRSESQKTPPPAWVKDLDYILPEEIDINADIEKVSNEILDLQKRKVDLISNLEETVSIKDLLFETGKPLEQAVNLALKILGYQSENYNDGNLEFDNVILSPEGDRFIGECEGKDNTATNIDKFRQLEENIQSDLQREEVKEPAIGILFGNGYRLTKPQERAEQFTTKCLASAKRGTILIRTMDLYPVVKYIKQNGDLEYAKACRLEISASKGKIVNFPSIPH